jgi:hypothetical protein
MNNTTNIGFTNNTRAIKCIGYYSWSQAALSHSDTAVKAGIMSIGPAINTTGPLTRIPGTWELLVDVGEMALLFV